MSTESTIHEGIDDAAATVGSVWPIHSFVTANPLSGFENVPFGEAVTQAADLLGGRGYPSRETFRAALDDGRIDRELLESELADRGYEADPETLLERVDTAVEPAPTDEGTKRVDRVLTKWLSAFLDEGHAAWSMPGRDDGFYAAFREMAPYDAEVPDDGVLASLPETPTEAIEAVLEPYPEGQWVPVFEEQLAALPGWTGFIKQRADDEGAWQSEHPIALADYLAVRLALLDGFGADIEPSTGPESADAAPADEPAEALLSAWAASYRSAVVDRVAAESRSLAEREPSGRPDAQLVFCIDTRSEVIRRHVEAEGDYETHGYAGFFGVPMEYQGYDAETPVDACPPIVEPQHRVSEIPTERDAKARRDRRSSVREAAGAVVKKLKTNPASAFGFVENAGSGYGLALAARTLVPGRVRDLLGAADDAVPDDREFCEQTVHHQHAYAGDLPVGMTREEKVEYAATAFELMGWEEFGRLVAFVGHASETTNNPYNASLDCGACAGNPGGPNARVLASICADPDVRATLRERGFDLPEDTVFLAGEHNTTTDEIELYGDVPESHADDLARLRADLDAARESAAAERAESMGGDASAGVDETERRAGDWAETRPEWGLAGNAGFVVGPRELTSGLDLDGRAFLHSYDWSTDPDGDALEAILVGPLVVTQWINAQYYFSTVDNAAYGSGSKVTQNPVGNVGVYQGNGGDLMTGLPRQSLMAADDEPYHQPLRLSTVLHAPVERVTGALADHDEVTELLDNDWLSLTVVDPTREHRAFRYERDLTWAPASDPSAAGPEAPTEPEAPAEPQEPVAPAVADD
ncbi:DUF2309 domain-containing protein [Halorubrum sp. AD140]|uniref:DUF2309 domain-containing protein n=1 Tax=Halorubrum sp. AD140 TaxID=3050073 RepID=UPI002ACCDC65|nr:DUF2309 domain-containing protein [Halorubrum sp. AD140]MDZ5811882.1 DUF2309 domain-containing protein [Halorubrum sp. AD140]